MDRIHTLLAAHADELKQMSLNIHDNPELGLQEHKACRWQTELLLKHGFALETGFCGLDTAYKASYKGKKPGPVIAMLSEYDALPGIGHGCGHNLIALVAVAAGIAMKPLADEYGGEIRVYGTPAEETFGGKVTMAKAGAFDDCDAAMMAHPAWEDRDSSDSIALRAFRIEFFGKTAHAAGNPEDGANALDAMINLFNLINALRQQTKPDARIHGIITHGGEAPNVIPDYTSALFYARGEKMAYVNELYEKIRACAEGAALATGCTVKLSKAEEDFMDQCSSRTLSELACDRLETLGVHPRRTGCAVESGSTDMGDVSYRCPAIQLYFRMGEAPDGNLNSSHTREFAACAGTDGAMNAALTYAEAFALTAKDLMTKPELLAAVKAEFAAMPKP